MARMQPDRIGRYRLDRLLATQATCETHAGWDEQLDRQVLRYKEKRSTEQRGNGKGL